MCAEKVDCHHDRVPYSTEVFEEKDLSSTTDPFVQFTSWFAEAQACNELKEPNAMSLATASKEGKPSVRTVLMKETSSDSGVLFYTNYGSRKGRELLENPFAAVVFHWPPLHRQVRIEGRVEKIQSEDSKAYFHKRSVESQISAAVSPQSSVVESRSSLQDKWTAMKDKYGDNSSTVPYPDHWGGFRIVPDTFEFWQGQTTRFHDRFLFSKQLDGSWKLQALAP